MFQGNHKGVLAMKVQDIMQTNVITISPNTEIREIAKLLCDHHISGVPVIDLFGNLIGIVSEGDLLHKETHPRVPEAVGFLGALIYYRGVKQYESDLKKLVALKASEIMTHEVITLDKDASIEEAASLMINHNVKRLPIMENGKMVGIITRKDVIKVLIEE
ncbi:CBS domain protein [Desulfitobacterium hafniense DP7]|nr:CBS domain protein [Desulfitobacterium hafniense DP7]